MHFRHRKGFEKMLPTLTLKTSSLLFLFLKTEEEMVIIIFKVTRLYILLMGGIIPQAVKQEYCST